MESDFQKHPAIDPAGQKYSTPVKLRLKMYSAFKLVILKLRGFSDATDHYLCFLVCGVRPAL